MAAPFHAVLGAERDSSSFGLVPVETVAARPTYFKRHRMEVDLHDVPAATSPAGFRSEPWSPCLIEAHAGVLCECFQGEIDAQVFASLANLDGCRTLMTEVVRRAGFVPEATWLIIGPDGPCATIQGLREPGRVGSIQNVGVAPTYRNRGLGRCLLMHALNGFLHAGLRLARLEVTAQNEGAIRLYRRLGFRRSKTLYRAVAPRFEG